MALECANRPEVRSHDTDMCAVEFWKSLQKVIRYKIKKNLKNKDCPLEFILLVLDYFWLQIMVQGNGLVGSRKLIFRHRLRRPQFYFRRSTADSILGELQSTVPFINM